MPPEGLGGVERGAAPGRRALSSEDEREADVIRACIAEAAGPGLGLTAIDEAAASEADDA